MERVAVELIVGVGVGGGVNVDVCVRDRVPEGVGVGGGVTVGVTVVDIDEVLVSDMLPDGDHEALDDRLEVKDGVGGGVIVSEWVGEGKV